MVIRSATPSDSHTIARYLFMAMEEIVYQFIGRKDEEMALSFLNHFTAKTDNQYSWQNCFIGEVNGEIIAVANVYDGADLQRLRKPIVEFVRSNFNPVFDPEPESQSGEIYLDCFAVSPAHRGQGIGLKMLQFLIEEVVHQQGKVLGLLVEKEKINAKRLYKKAGFVYKNDQKLMGAPLEHWQIHP